jgi:site-specific recombinase XerD
MNFPIQNLLVTGLRISELATLRISEVEIFDRKGTLYMRAGKGSKARRIPLDKQTRQALANYFDERQPASSTDREDGSERLFLGQRGPISEPGINYLVTTYAYQVRLERCSSYTLRHSFAKNLVDAGTPLDQVATLLGHESLDTTRLYTRPSPKDLGRAVRCAAGEV